MYGRYSQNLKENKNISKESAIANTKNKLKCDICIELKHIETLENFVKRLEKEANNLSESAKRKKVCFNRI